MGKISFEKLGKKLALRDLEFENIYSLGKNPTLFKLKPGIYIFYDSEKEWSSHPKKIIRGSPLPTKISLLLKEFLTTKFFVVEADDKIYLGLEEKVSTFLPKGEMKKDGIFLNTIKDVTGGKKVFLEKNFDPQIFPCYRWSEFSKMIDNPVKEIISADISQIKKDFEDYISEKTRQEYDNLCEKLKEGAGIEKLLFLQNLLEIEKIYST